MAVKGLGTAAYTASTAYAAASHTHNYAGSSSAGGSATSVVRQLGTADSARHVWFSDGNDGSTGTGKCCYHDGIKYNPATSNLTITQINGVAVGSSPKFTDTDTKVTTTSITYPSSATNYYLTGSSTEATGTAGLSKFGSGVRMQVLAGTTSVEGKNELIIGNSTATGTAGNQSGILTLYNDKGKYFCIKGHAGDTSNRSPIYLPKATGTLVCHTTDTAIGSASKPVYISASGVATVCTSIDSSLYTNTTYSTFVKSGSTAAAGLVPKPSTTAGTTKYLREDATWAVPPDNNTTYSAMTQSEAETGTATTARSITAAVLKAAILKHSTPAKSLAANGYVKLDSGLIIQWGYADGSSTSYNTTYYSRYITFPTSFSADNNVYAIVALGDSYNNTSYIEVCQYSNVTKSGFYFGQAGVGAGSNTTLYPKGYWIALGS